MLTLRKKQMDQAKKIFIVDDDLDLTDSLKNRLLNEVSSDVQIFYTGEECITHLDESPDVIILAYFLNSVHKDAANGMDILQIIKKLKPATHVIMLSSQEHYGIALKTIINGADQYVMKGDDAFDQIIGMINSME